MARAVHMRTESFCDIEHGGSGYALFPGAAKGLVSADLGGCGRERGCPGQYNRRGRRRSRRGPTCGADNLSLMPSFAVTLVG